jgi:hypothetical protein
MFKIVDREKIFSEIATKSNANLSHISDIFTDYVESNITGQGLENGRYQMFSRTGEPMNFTVRDTCIYGINGKRFKSVGDRYAVKWVKNLERFQRGEHGWEAVIGDGEVYDITIPKAGFVEFTKDGLYDSVLGLPFSTVKEREDALHSWTKRGFDREIAEKMMTYFLSGDNYPEARGVGKWAGTPHDDYLYKIDVNLDPGFAGQHMGALILDI